MISTLRTKLTTASVAELETFRSIAGRHAYRGPFGETFKGVEWTTRVVISIRKHGLTPHAVNSLRQALDMLNEAQTIDAWVAALSTVAVAA